MPCLNRSPTRARALPEPKSRARPCPARTEARSVEESAEQIAPACLSDGDGGEGGGLGAQNPGAELQRSEACVDGGLDLGVREATFGPDQQAQGLAV